MQVIHTVLTGRGIERGREISETVLRRFGVWVDPRNCATLRRASMTLHRWAEQECGDSNDYASWCIVRDDDGKTYRETYPHTGKVRRERIADRESGALRTAKRICDANGLHFYHQTDPRGCALYVSTEPLNDQNYPSRGVAIG